MNEEREFRSWGDLLDELQKLTPEQLAQEVQIFPPHNTPETIPLTQGIGFGTIQYYCHDPETNEVLDDTRGTVDNKHHPEQFVILTDHNPFSEDGDTHYTMQEDGSMIGNVSGKVVDGPFGKPREGNS